VLLLAFLIGVAGSRSLTAPAAVAWSYWLSSSWLPISFGGLSSAAGVGETIHRAWVTKFARAW
jgi:uncharacterized membrane protein